MSPEPSLARRPDPARERRRNQTKRPHIPRPSVRDPILLTTRRCWNSSLPGGHVALCPRNFAFFHIAREEVAPGRETLQAAVLNAQHGRYCTCRRFADFFCLLHSALAQLI